MRLEPRFLAWVSAWAFVWVSAINVADIHPHPLVSLAMGGVAGLLSPWPFRRTEGPR